MSEDKSNKSDDGLEELLARAEEAAKLIPDHARGPEPEMKKLRGELSNIWKEDQRLVDCLISLAVECKAQGTIEIRSGSPRTDREAAKTVYRELNQALQKADTLFKEFSQSKRDRAGLINSMNRERGIVEDTDPITVTSAIEEHQAFINDFSNRLSYLSAHIKAIDTGFEVTEFRGRQKNVGPMAVAQMIAMDLRQFGYLPVATKNSDYLRTIESIFSYLGFPAQKSYRTYADHGIKASQP